MIFKILSYDNGKVIAIRPMYTDNELSDYEGATIALQMSKEDITLFARTGLVDEISQNDLKIAFTLSSEVSPMILSVMMHIARLSRKVDQFRY